MAAFFLCYHYNSALCTSIDDIMLVLFVVCGGLLMVDLNIGKYS